MVIFHSYVSLPEGNIWYLEGLGTTCSDPFKGTPRFFLLRGTARELQSQLQPSLTRVNLRGHEEIIRNPTQNAGKSWIIMDYWSNICGINMMNNNKKKIQLGMFNMIKYKVYNHI